jgi:hypothetical protein
MLQRSASFLLPCLLASVSACSGSETESREQEPAEADPAAPDEQTPGSGGSGIVLAPLPEPGIWSMTEEDLSTRLPEGTILTGVSRDPIDGSIYLLDPAVGIYQLTQEAASLVFAVGSIVPESGAVVGEFSDMTALGAGRFALTVPNEGYLLDVGAGTMWLHFCYLPSEPSPSSPTAPSISLSLEAQGITVRQETDALAYDIFTGTIFAQPQTIDVSTSEIYGSEIANFNELTGEPQDWLLMESTNLRAGGMALSDSELLLGVGQELRTYTRGSSTAHDVQTLALPEISGLSGTSFDSILAVSRSQRILYHLQRSAPAL